MIKASSLQVGNTYTYRFRERGLMLGNKITSRTVTHKLMYIIQYPKKDKPLGEYRFRLVSITRSKPFPGEMPIPTSFNWTDDRWFTKEQVETLLS